MVVMQLLLDWIGFPFPVQPPASWPDQQLWWLLLVAKLSRVASLDRLSPRCSEELQLTRYCYRFARPRGRPTLNFRSGKYPSLMFQIISMAKAVRVRCIFSATGYVCLIIVDIIWEIVQFILTLHWYSTNRYIILRNVRSTAMCVCVCVCVCVLYGWFYFGYRL